MNVDDTMPGIPRDPVPSAGGSGPVHKGRRSIANVLDRAGQQRGADYVRSLDIDGLSAEVGSHVHKVEAGVRARPLVSVLAAVVAGFVLGRIMRD